MNENLSRIGIAGIFFLLIFLTGFWVHHLGKPYPLAAFTIHKLIALGAAVFLAVMIFRTNLPSLQSLQIMMIVLTAVFLVATIISGGLLSLEKAMPSYLLRLHQFLPYLTVFSVGVTLYLLFIRIDRLFPAS